LAFRQARRSSGHLAIASWLSPPYEIRKEFIEKLIVKQPRALKGLQISWLRILHKMPGVPEYVVFVTCNTDLKAALTNAGYTLEPVAGANRRRHKPIQIDGSDSSAIEN
jgi:hypothetical protein